VAAAVLLIAAAAAAVRALGGSSEEAGGAGPTAKASGTGTVARRTLAERVTVEGTIGYAGESTVLARLGGTVTELPAVGDVVRRGEELYGIGGEPVILMYGKVPAYRALAEDVAEGPDVEQLETNLEALGYYPGTVDEDFTSSTAAAVEAWQEDLGLEATGEVELGRVAFLPGARRITQLKTTLGEALAGGGGGGGGEGSQLTAYEVPGIGEASEVPEGEAEKEEEAEERQPRGKPNHEGEPPKPERKPTAEPQRRESQPQSAGKPEAEKEPEPTEEAEAPSTPVLEASSTQRIVSVAFDADQQSLAHRGQSVGVVLPDGTEVKGKVRRLEAVESSGEGGPEESESGVEATISVTGRHRIPALDGAAVSVLVTERVRKHVLSVPLTALVAIGGERFAVFVRGTGGRHQVVVSPGLAADGYVEVRGKGLRAGMKVETGG
jgi:peptidoglycan hydrolase-like protein with peptidoglycan-binding domain